MDVFTLAVAIAVAKKLPDTAVGQAVAAAERSETAAELAEQRSFAVSMEDDVLVFNRNEE